MRTETKWALIAAIAVFVVMFLEKMFGLHTPEKFSTWQIVDLVASFLVLIVVYLLFCKEKRDVDFNGVMTWKQGFWASAVMTLMFIVLGVFVLLLFVQLISPEFPKFFSDGTQMSTNGKDPFNNTMHANLWFLVIFGLLFSILFPLFTRKSASRKNAVV